MVFIDHNFFKYPFRNSQNNIFLRLFVIILNDEKSLFHKSIKSKNIAGKSKFTIYCVLYILTLILAVFLLYKSLSFIVLSSQKNSTFLEKLKGSLKIEW